MVPDEERMIKQPEPEHKPTSEELEARRKREEELYRMGFRPFTCEW